MFHFSWFSPAWTAAARAALFPATVIMLIMLSIMAAQFAHYLAHGTKASIMDL